MREPLERERGVTDVGELCERGHGAAGEFDFAREFVGNAGGGLAGLKDDVIGGGGDGPLAAFAEPNGIGRGRFRVRTRGERAGSDSDTGVAAPREAGEVVAARVAERLGQALAVIDRGFGGIRRSGDEWAERGIGDLPDVATVAVAPALAREVGGIGGIEDGEGEFAIGEVEHGGELEGSSILLFPLSLNLFPRGGTSLTKEEEERARERGKS